MPSGIKHYCTSETLINQRGLSAIGLNLHKKRFESEANKDGNTLVPQNGIFFFQMNRKDTFMLINLSITLCLF